MDRGNNLLVREVLVICCISLKLALEVYMVDLNRLGPDTSEVKVGSGASCNLIGNSVGKRRIRNKDVRHNHAIDRCGDRSLNQYKWKGKKSQGGVKVTK